jgi:hypothetical protein
LHGLEIFLKVFLVLMFNKNWLTFISSYNYNSFIMMRGSGKNVGGAKKHPTYIGIFAKDPK